MANAWLALQDPDDLLDGGTLQSFGLEERGYRGLGKGSGVDGPIGINASGDGV